MRTKQAVLSVESSSQQAVSLLFLLEPIITEEFGIHILQSIIIA